MRRRRARRRGEENASSFDEVGAASRKYVQINFALQTSAPRSSALEPHTFTIVYSTKCLARHRRQFRRKNFSTRRSNKIYASMDDSHSNCASRHLPSGLSSDGSSARWARQGTHISAARIALSPDKISVTVDAQGACPGGRKDGEAHARTPAGGHHHNTLGDLAHGVERVRARPVGA